MKFAPCGDRCRLTRRHDRATTQTRSGSGWKSASSSLPRSTGSSPEDKARWFRPNAWRKCSLKSKRNPDIELVSLRSLPATGLTQSLTAILGSAPGGVGMYRHGIEIAVSGSYLKMLNYVGQLERLPAKIMWGNMELQAGAYPVVTLKITLYTLSPEKTWLLI